MVQRVFVDANIFVSRTIMDWLFHLRRANEGMFQLHSTNDVFAEALAATRDRNPRAPGSLLEDRMNKIRECVDEVVPTFPGNLSFTGSDEGDYHVHAAAIASRADIILTQNKPRDITQNPDDEPYEVYSADDFFILVVQSNPRCLVSCTKNQLAYWAPEAKGSSTISSSRLTAQHSLKRSAERSRSWQWHRDGPVG
ncbi:PIN domain-containing protein [Brachybacterium sp. EF45031]|uniref:PIN domain-containing protein n=1 Tax=Brachybacterium sillae TaxID=2810536 RepID=UPI00217EFAB9|nr:PIN domain-containing protein [Brachybacterium sillae]MCS6711978.1 PIN domain-containing protein [Brachybacterium sillae]